MEQRPLESKWRTFAYILTQNFGHSLVLTEITQNNVDVLEFLDVFQEFVRDIKTSNWALAETLTISMNACVVF